MVTVPGETSRAIGARSAACHLALAHSRCASATPSPPVQPPATPPPLRHQYGVYYLHCLLGDSGSGGRRQGVLLREGGPHRDVPCIQATCRPQCRRGSACVILAELQPHSAPQVAPRVSLRAASASSAFTGTKVSAQTTRRASRRVAMAAQAKVSAPAARAARAPSAMLPIVSCVAGAPLPVAYSLAAPAVSHALHACGAATAHNRCAHFPMPPALPLHCTLPIALPIAIAIAIPHHCQIGDTLEEFLLEATPDAKLRQLMMSMSEAIRTIAYQVGRRRGAVGMRATRTVGAGR